MAVAEARILAAASGEARAITSVRKGEQLNVVRVPESRSDDWVQVQYVSGGRAFPAGYVKLAELGNWESEESKTAMTILKVFGPEPSAPDAEIRRQIGRLSEFISRFAITPQGPQANFEMAQWNLVLARRAKQQGDPALESHLDAATGQLAMAAVSQDLAGQIAQAHRELEALKEVEKPPAPVRAPAAARRPENELSRAEQAWRRGRYREALGVLDRLIRERPGYTPAIALREKVRRAQQLESRTR